MTDDSGIGVGVLATQDSEVVSDQQMMAEFNKVLQAGLGKPFSTLYESQREVLKKLILERKEWVTFVAGTGRGKTETYFVAAKVLRKLDHNAGPVVVISPYLALINDQVSVYLLSADCC